MRQHLTDGRSLRDAEPSDLEAIVGIYNDSIPGRLATADTEPVPVGSRVPWFEAHTPDRRPLWVLTGDDGVEGWVSLQDFYFGRPAYDATAEVSVYVGAVRRGTGVGGRLLDAVIDGAPTLGIDTLIAMIFGHNDPSLRLFAGRGFVRWGRLPGIAVLDEVPRDVVILGRRVDPRSS